MKRSELKTIIKEMLVEEALENGWPKKANHVSQPAVINQKPLSAAFKKLADKIQGDLKPIKSGNSYIEEIVKAGDFDSETVVSTELTDWLATVDSERGVVRFDEDTDPKEKGRISAESKQVLNQTNYVILGENFAKINIMVRDSYSGSLYNTTFFFMEKEEIITNQAKMDKDAAMADEPVFLLGYWSDPYRDNREYYWAGPFDDRKEALARGKSLQKNGQPKTFRDWAGGSNQAIRGEAAFRKKAKAAGLNIRENI